MKYLVLALSSILVSAASGTVAFAECGIASHYSEGSMTASGERYNSGGISAAHKSLPFGTRVLVTNQHTGRSVTVRINDRGPFVGGRIIDLSTGAKNQLGMDGLAPVCIQVVGGGDGPRQRQVYASNGGNREGHRVATRERVREAARDTDFFGDLFGSFGDDDDRPARRVRRSNGRNTQVAAVRRANYTQSGLRHTGRAYS